MAQWWEGLSQLGRVFACVALPATLLLLLQTALGLFGLGNHDADGDIDGQTDIDMEMDTDLDPALDADTEVPEEAPADGAWEAARDPGLRWFTLRGAVAFFCLFGWTGLVLLRWQWPALPAVLVSLLAGCGAMLTVALMIKLFLRLQSDGTADIRHALGLSATVYIPVPASRRGRGKVNVTMQSRYMEWEAVTDEPETLPSGTEVLVCGISGGNTLVVRKK